MKFFVPYTASDVAAELVWSEARAALLDLGLPTTRRRVQALSLHGDDGDWVLAVGMPMPWNGEPALLIFEATAAPFFFVCTASRGVDQGPPFGLGISSRCVVFDFEAVPDGCPPTPH